MEAIMTEMDGWLLIGVAVLLLGMSAMRLDAWRAWMRDHLQPWLQRIRHH
jgi:hypothetical protein